MLLEQQKKEEEQQKVNNDLQDIQNRKKEVKALIKTDMVKQSDNIKQRLAQRTKKRLNSNASTSRLDLRGQALT